MDEISNYNDVEKDINDETYSVYNPKNITEESNEKPISNYNFLGRINNIISRADSLPDGVIRTGYLAALTYSNEIRSTIKGFSESVLSVLSNINMKDSTTEIPNEENKIVKEIINSILKMLANIEEETRTIEEMAHSYEDIDKKLLESLDDSDTFRV